MKVDYLRLCSRASDNPAFIWFPSSYFLLPSCGPHASSEGLGSDSRPGDPVGPSDHPSPRLGWGKVLPPLVPA